MTVCVFLGPTLPAAAAQILLDAVYLPPVRQGDVYKAAIRYRPHAIGIIDGYFQNTPSVWHKEILWAMAQGIHVFGSASMGALRAAELADFGMAGVGMIFDAYRCGTLPPYDAEIFEDDDEVAVIHGPPETAYLAASEALVNIRVTLAAACDAGVIGVRTRDTLVALGKSQFFAERSYKRLFACAAGESVSRQEIDALAGWLPSGRIDQKRSDAEAMLIALRGVETAAKRVDYDFQHTTMWQDLITRAEATATELNPRHERVLEELRLEEAAYHAARQAALLRMLALAEAKRRDLSPSLQERRSARDHFRLSAGLLDGHAIEHWQKTHHLDSGAFERLIEDEAYLAVLEGLVATDIELYLLDHLRINGDYVRLAARADAKQRVLAGREPEQADALTALRIASWYFRKRLNRRLPDDIEDYAVRQGFKNTQSFYRALLREHLYLLELAGHENPSSN